MIRIYSSIFSTEPAETHFAGNLSLDEWLSRYPGYTSGDSQPFSCFAGGVHVHPEQWSNVYPSETPVDLKLVPQGSTLNILAIALPFIFGPISAASLLVPSIPSLPSRQDQGRGSEISIADVRANVARLGQVIPEGAGHYIRYPDFLIPRRSYFVDKREQYIEMLLCIGKGKYELSNIKIGDTLVSAIPDDVTVTQYQPGADLSSETAAEYWHSAPEVGGTSKGGSGLELASPYAPINTTNTGNFDYSAYTVTGTFDPSWANGTSVRIVANASWTVADGGLGVADIITGDWSEVEPFVGMLIEIAGDNASTDYRIGSVSLDVNLYGDVTLEEYLYNIDDGIWEWVPVTSLGNGTKSMTIGYRGLLYNVSAISETSMTVARQTDTGEEDATWSGFITRASVASTITVDEFDQVGDWVGPFAVTPKGETTKDIQWDIFFPAGLVSVADNGAQNNLSSTVEIEWREIGTVPWNTISKTYTERSLDQMGFTESLSLPSPLAVEMRARRTGLASTKISDQDKTQWYGLRCKFDAPSSYAGVTTLAVKIRSGDRISAQSDQKINCECTRILPVLSGGAIGAEAATRSIGSFAAHIAKDIGYTDAQIDLEELQRLEDTWTTRGDTFDFFMTETTVRDAINTCLRAGFAEMTVDRGRIRPVRDEIRTQFEHMYTPQNMTEPLRRTFSSVRPDDADGVEVEYTDAETWTKKTELCLLPGDAGVKLEKLRLEGITDRTKAWRIGMRQRRIMAYRRWNMTFATELDALNSRYMSYAALADDVPGYGQSAILETYSLSGSTYTMQVSEPLTWVSGATHYIAIRNQDGTLNGPYVATPGADDFEVLAGVVSMPAIEDGKEPPHILFGDSTRWTFPALIANISPNGFESVNVAAVNYDARVYADDDNAPT